jgi:hypothetical protein
VGTTSVWPAKQISLPPGLPAPRPEIRDAAGIDALDA